MARMLALPSRIGAVVLGAVLAGSVLGCGGSSPSPIYRTATPGTTVPASPTTTATVVPTAAPVAGKWQLAPASPALDGVALVDVVWTGERFAAIGNYDDGLGASFFSSTDGVSWEARSTPYAATTISGLAHGSGGLVAVGIHDKKMTSWHSADGISWQQAPDAAPLRPAGTNEFALGSVAAVGGGWIAVGGEYPECKLDFCAPLRAVVWTSADGWNWTQVPATPALANAFMAGIAPSKSGYVAVGWAGQSATIWTSPDAATWTAVPDSPTFHSLAGADQTLGAGASSVTLGYGLFVAVGQTFSMAETSAAMAWWSADGTTWSSATVDRALNGMMVRVAVVPTGFLGVGPSGDPSCLGGIWSSGEGKGWKCVADDPAFKGFAPGAAASAPGREIVVGWGSPTDSPNGAVWYRDISRP